jgi:hypothetical protein
MVVIVNSYTVIGHDFFNKHFIDTPIDTAYHIPRKN